MKIDNYYLYSQKMLEKETETNNIQKIFYKVEELKKKNNAEDAKKYIKEAFELEQLDNKTILINAESYIHIVENLDMLSLKLKMDDNVYIYNYRK